LTETFPIVFVCSFSWTNGRAQRENVALGQSFIAFDGKQKKEKTIVKTQTISLGSFVYFTHEVIPDLARRQLTHSVSTLK
jgi:hypothetical protein